MTSYESMRSKLLPLGLYRLAQGDVTDSELKAYAEGLDILFDALDEMERESFIPTAQSYGLSEREKFIFKETPELTVEERRARLLGMERNWMCDATAAGYSQFLSDCGLEDFSVAEHPTRQRVNVYIDDDLTEGEKTLINEKIAKGSPAHLNVFVTHHDGVTVEL